MWVGRWFDYLASTEKAGGHQVQQHIVALAHPQLGTGGQLGENDEAGVGVPQLEHLGGWVGGWVAKKVEEIKAIRTSYCEPWVLR